MKSILSLCARGRFIFKLAGMLLLAGAIASPAFAQNTNIQSGVAAAPFDTNDISHFPPLDLLPGKVPSHVWIGLGGVWAQRHARWKNSATNDMGAVVFLGDSITQGWNSLAKDFPNMKVANRGIGGDITSGVLYRLNADVLGLNPKAIVLLIGTNDLGDGADPADVASNTELILKAIKKFNPNLKVIVCKIMPRADGGKEADYTVKIKKANAFVEDYVNTEPNFAVCDTWSALLDINGLQNPADFNNDRLHLNATGYAVWKSTLEPVMAKLNFAQ